MKAKSKKVLKIVAIVLAALIVAGAVAAGIYFGVQSERCSGYVRDAEGAPMEGVSVTNGRQVQSGVVELNGYLYFGGMDGAVYKLSRQGTLEGKINLGSPVMSAPAVYQGLLIVLDLSGNLSKITL